MSSYVSLIWLFCVIAVILLGRVFRGRVFVVSAYVFVLLCFCVFTYLLYLIDVFDEADVGFLIIVGGAFLDPCSFFQIRGSVRKKGMSSFWRLVLFFCALLLVVYFLFSVVFF